ncbi:hypothetical protein [Aeromonas veronii]|uniref:Uncharacterized protein n=1 Tax=Aeromonas veronii AMC34 TaxID=1073383 RepID=K1IMU4_AERVE|nr:hypothetical protein [Aeromonas veronii]EKB17222.1 hypothetical protein HMPREF1168_03449 [Aeromonas veronii AMC34]
MTTFNSQKLICSKGLKKDRAATEALKRRQQKRAEIELRQLASQYGIDHREIQ